MNNIRYASIIIDDPLLRENYGYLNYRKLLNLMDKHNFFINIAFIPFNYKRTNAKIASLFRERPDRFNLCVHGCDHTQNEFGRKNIEYLNRLIKLATSRMEEHRRRTGIPFDKIMVFPQGLFSNEALEALRINNYLAAINTSITPVTGSLTFDFPIFKRYTPEEFLNNNQDFSLMALHHDYLQDGGKRLAEIVDRFNTMYNARWDSVGNIVRNYITDRENSNVIIQNNVNPNGFNFHGMKKNIRICMRRYASEFRDNYLSRNKLILNMATKIMNSI